VVLKAIVAIWTPARVTEPMQGATSIAVGGIIGDRIEIGPYMERSRSPNLVNVLRSTVSDIQMDTALGAADPDLIELKHILIRRIAELEFKESPRVAGEELVPEL
jgi:hypothetical protein